LTGYFIVVTINEGCEFVGRETSSDLFVTIYLPTKRGIEKEIIDIDVTELKINIDRVKGLDLSALTQCKKIESLELSGYKNTCKNWPDSFLVHISHMCGLKSLTIKGMEGLENLNLGPLKELEKLEVLKIVHCGELRRIDLSPLAKLTKINEIEITTNLFLEELDLSPLASLSNLAKLVISTNPLPKIDFGPLRHCLMLKYLDISSNRTGTLDLSNIARIPNLETLDVSGGTNRLQLDLSPLAECSNLRKITIRPAGNDALDIEPLSRCSVLEEIHIAEGAWWFSQYYSDDLNELDLSALSKLKSLKKLHVWLSGGTYSVILPENKSVESVHLGIGSAKSLSLNALGACTNLREFILSHSEIEHINLEPLSNCYNLQKISIEINPKTVSLTAPHPPNLQEFVIGTRRDSVISGEQFNLSGLSECKQMRVFKMVGEKSQAFPTEFLSKMRFLELLSMQIEGPVNLEHISQCESLHTLKLSVTSSGKLDVAPLEDCRELIQFELEDDELTEIDLTPFSKMHKLEEISLYSRTLLKVKLAQNPSLKHIVVSRSRIKSIDLEPLSACTNLETISLSSKLEEIDLHPLCNLGSLKEIDLSNNELTEISLPQMTAGSNLRNINLNHNQLTHLNLNPLRNCIYIENLDLGWNPIAEIETENLPCLKNLSSLNLQRTELKRIDLTFIRGAQLTDIEIRGDHLSSLDLSPLSECIRLKQVQIFSKRLKKLDLKPLSFCPSLYYLRIEGSKSLRSLSLTPLRKCSNLKYLYLSNNGIRHLNLKPLANLEKLRDLHLDNNNFSTINLEPLATCKRLRELRLNSSKLKSFVYDPLFFLQDFVAGEFPKEGCIDPLYQYWNRKWNRWSKSFKQKEESTLLREYGQRLSWTHFARTIDDILEGLSEGDRFRESYWILKLFNLSEFWGYAGSLVDLFERIEPHAEFEDARVQLEDLLIDGLLTQIENKGPTIFLDVENLALNAKIAYSLKKILTRRQEEVEETVVPIVKNTAYIRHLWVTEYGFRVLSAVGLENTTDLAGLEEIRKQFKTLGVELNTKVKKSSSGRYAIKLSPEMREFIAEISRGYRDLSFLN